MSTSIDLGQPQCHTRLTWPLLPRNDRHRLCCSCYSHMYYHYHRTLQWCCFWCDVIVFTTSIFIFIFIFFCLCINRSMYLSISMYAMHMCIYTYKSIHLSIHLSVFSGSRTFTHPVNPIAMFCPSVISLRVFAWAAFPCSRLVASG